MYGFYMNDSLVFVCGEMQRTSSNCPFSTRGNETMGVDEPTAQHGIPLDIGPINLTLRYLVSFYTMLATYDPFLITGSVALVVS